MCRVSARRKRMADCLREDNISNENNEGQNESGNYGQETCSILSRHAVTIKLQHEVGYDVLEAFQLKFSVP